jgi:hypothetical protein
MKSSLLLALFFVAENGFFRSCGGSLPSCPSAPRAHMERLAKEGRRETQLALSAQAARTQPACLARRFRSALPQAAECSQEFSAAPRSARRLEQTLSDRCPWFGGNYGKPIGPFAVMTIGVTYAAALVIGGAGAQDHCLEQVRKRSAIRVASPLAFRGGGGPAAGDAGFASTGRRRASSSACCVCGPRFERALGTPRMTFTNLVAEGARLGVIHAVERDMIEGVALTSPDMPGASPVMTPAGRVCSG